jgi:hypothetical protein
MIAMREFLVMQRSVAKIALLFALVATASVPLAHHSVLGQFDVSRSITLTGTIVKVEWINPHPYLHLDVTDSTGAVLTWALSTIPIALLRKAGITREALGGKPGEVVTVAIHPALNGQRLGWVTRITYADGHFYALFE